MRIILNAQVMMFNRWCSKVCLHEHMNIQVNQQTNSDTLPQTHMHTGSVPLKALIGHAWPPHHGVTSLFWGDRHQHRAPSQIVRASVIKCEIIISHAHNVWHHITDLYFQRAFVTSESAICNLKCKVSLVIRNRHQKWVVSKRDCGITNGRQKWIALKIDCDITEWQERGQCMGPRFLTDIDVQNNLSVWCAQYKFVSCRYAVCVCVCNMCMRMKSMCM